MIVTERTRGTARVALVWLGLAAGSTAQTSLKAELIADGFSEPVQVVQAPGDDERLFVVEQRGLVKVIHDGAVLPTPFLDVRDVVSLTKARGILSLEFHPDYESNGYFYLCTTRHVEEGAHPTVIVRYSVTGDPNVADPGSAFDIIEIPQVAVDHNGEDLHFGPDGYLYIAMGDGGSPGDPGCRAQRGDVLLGKILRLDVDGGSPYAIPPTNPHVSDPTHLDEIWAKGLRNPWRMSFDRQTGDLYIGDVGQNVREEINFQPPGVGGVNYGWKVMEGTTCFDPDPLDVDCPAATASCFAAEFATPILELDTDDFCSVIGGFVYRGCAIPDLQGTYFYGDYCKREIWSFRFDGNTLTEHANRTPELDPAGLAFEKIVSFGEDNAGELYVVDLLHGIFKIVPDVPPSFADLGSALAGSSGETPEFDLCGILEPGNTADMRLEHAPANAPALLVVSPTELPVPILGGVLVPGFPFFLIQGLVTDADGQVTVQEVDGGLFGMPIELVMQFLIADLGMPDLAAMSNAIRVSWN